MAKLNLMLAPDATSGKESEYIYGVRNNRMYFYRRPDRDSITAGQQEVRRAFRRAAEYAKAAKADPELRAFYEGLAAARGVRLHTLIMTDSLRPPEVESIDLGGFKGMIGDPVQVVALDDVGVVSVSVEIHAADGTLLEQGPAAYDPVSLKWVYAATAAHPTGTPVTITATAVDRPGGRGSKFETWS